MLAVHQVAPTEQTRAIRWGVEKRLEFIEFRLFWEGGINRADIIEQFGVSVPQASKDLSLYEEKAPGNLAYDKRHKRYFAAPGFKPVFLKPEADRYLMQLRTVADRVVAADETWLSDMPETDAMPVPHRRVNVEVLRGLLAAMRRCRAIEILYQSMNPTRPMPTWRWITPHAFGNDGLRWHVRAYCHIDQKFKDFLLSRIIETRGTKPSEIRSETDHDWNDEVVLEIGPHPDLSETQKKVIALDYGMRGGRTKIRVRKALIYYALRRLGLDTDPAARRPQDQQIVLLNQDAAGPRLARQDNGEGRV